LDGICLLGTNTCCHGERWWGGHLLQPHFLLLLLLLLLSLGAPWASPQLLGCHTLCPRKQAPGPIRRRGHSRIIPVKQ
jgi:hypothetical protein